MGRSIPVLDHYQVMFNSAFETGIFQDIYETSASSIRVPEFESLSRRAQATLPQKCLDEIINIENDPALEKITRLSTASCAGVKQWWNEVGTLVAVADYRSCDTNYQSIKSPDLKFTCEPSQQVPFPH